MNYELAPDAHINGVRLGCAACACGAALHCAALVFAETTPYAGVLAGFHGPREALFDDGAGTAHILCFFDLQECRTCVADWEKEVRVFLQASGFIAPTPAVDAPWLMWRG